MKIKHPKEHDQIIQWILNNPETLLKKLAFNEPFTDLKKNIQVDILKGKTVIGNFDVQLRYQSSEEIDDPYYQKDPNDYISSPNKINPICVINIIVNVKMESATEQLRELKKLYSQHTENTKGNRRVSQNYVLVSTNDTFKSFFTDTKFIFYKY